jgi:hypothetical protein
MQHPKVKIGSYRLMKVHESLAVYKQASDRKFNLTAEEEG